MIKTFYAYDDTFNAYDNARGHVHKYLLDYGVLTNKYLYTIENNHPAGWDCICVTVDNDGLDNIPPFTGNTYEMSTNEGNKWVCQNSSLLTVQGMVEGGCEIYYDGDLNCGVWVVNKPKLFKQKRV